MVIKQCEVCRQPYEQGTRNRQQFAASKYCSRKCAGRAKSHTADQQRIVHTKACQYCGKSYSAHYGQSVDFKQSKFCSRECANQAKQRSFESLYADIRIDALTNCHVWLNYKNQFGYGVVRFNGRRTVVHRIIWEHHNGPVPAGLQLDHICRNKLCCNPAHLRAVTAKVNILASYNLAAQNAKKVICPKCNGDYTERSDGGRYCKRCTREWTAKYVRERRHDDVEFRERQNAALQRYHEKLKNQPEAINMRTRNEKCPKCGGAYSTFPNGQRYCKPCRNQWQRARDARLKGV
jgi:uncharacterized Zn ribbon protein